MIIHQEKWEDVVAVAGSWSANTISLAGSELKYILIEAANETSTFDVKLIDKNSLNIIDARRNTFRYEKESIIPLLGKYTVQILNSVPTNETYNILLLINDNLH